MSYRQSILSVFEQLLTLVTERESDPFGYYQTSGKVSATTDFDGVATFAIVLVHEPLSEEAAVEEDRAKWTMHRDHDPDELVATATTFVDDHWR